MPQYFNRRRLKRQSRLGLNKQHLYCNLEHYLTLHYTRAKPTLIFVNFCFISLETDVQKISAEKATEATKPESSNIDVSADSKLRQPGKEILLIILSVLSDPLDKNADQNFENDTRRYAEIGKNPTRISLSYVPVIWKNPRECS